MRGLIENSFLKQRKTIVGVDEVGRGCLAGPVFAAAASLDYDKLYRLPDKSLELIRDSKTLSAKQRATIIPTIESCSLYLKVGSASVAEIEKFGIVPATFKAMYRALGGRSFDVLLIDGKQPLADYPGEQQAVVDGDYYCFSIAAASICAKEARDLFMKEQAKTYDKWGFESHVGYGTKLHKDNIATHGICPLHRRNFAPIKNVDGTFNSGPR